MCLYLCVPVCFCVCDYVSVYQSLSVVLQLEMFHCSHGECGCRSRTLRRERLSLYHRRPMQHFACGTFGEFCVNILQGLLKTTLGRLPSLHAVNVFQGHAEYVHSLTL
jgi:hypothetical protein